MICWLSSYMKSGNTWTRAFLTAYLNGEVHLDRLIGAPIAGQRILIDKWLGFPTFGMPPPRVESLRADAYRALGRACWKRGQPTFIKTHDWWKMTPRGEPLFPYEATFRVLLIVRDPRDVAVSLAHHLGEPVSSSVTHMAREDFALAVFGPHTRNQVVQHLGSWSLHFESWCDDSNLYCHIMRYEDMKRSPATAFRRMLEYLDIPIHEGKLETALTLSSLENLKKLEGGKGGFKEAAATADTAFFRKGEVGTHKGELAPEDRAKLELTHSKVMRRLGYL